MPWYGCIIIAVGWGMWVLPFFRNRRANQTAEQTDRRARWGIVLQGIAYALLWQNDFWSRPPQEFRLVLGSLFLSFAGALSWTSVRALGRQWRVDAGLNSNHQLVQSGVYRMVRHPIYTSKLCLLWGTGLLVTPWPMLILSKVLFLVGTEIRVRIEEALLAARYGEQFREYQRAVSAYVPFL